MSEVVERPSEAERLSIHAAPTEPAPYRWATVRALGVAVVLALLVSAWTKQAELVTLTSQISESTPPIASILCLLLLVTGGAVLLRSAGQLEALGRLPAVSRLIRRATLSNGEVLVVFTFLAITSAMPGVGLFRQVMPCLMVTQYFGLPADHLQEMATRIPTQWAPTDPEVARIFWEGSDVDVPTLGLGRVPVAGPVLAGIVRFFAGPTLIPWRYWLTPFLLWSAYLSAYFVAAFCLVALFRRTWEEDEHLTFPVSNLAVEMIRPERGLVAAVSFFRDPVVWIGLILAFVYNGLNALHVFNPAVPALGINYPLGALFTEAPWNEMSGLQIFYKPEILGVGYMVPSDVLFSIWFFTLASWIVRPFARMGGYMPAGFPFVTHQAMGAFVPLGLYFLYQGRVRLLEAARKAIGANGGLDDREEPLSFRVMLVLAIVGVAVVVTMPIVFGVVWWVSLLYFGIMFLVLVVYCRNRAEMGFPIVWGYPLYMQRQTMVNFLGSAAFVTGSEYRSFTLLSMFSWLQRSVNQAITSTGQEVCVAAHRLGGRRRTVAKVVLGALVFGIMLAFIVNLSTFYELGGLVLSSPGGIEGGQMTQEVLGQFRAVSQWIDQPTKPDAQKITYTTFGAVMVLAMVVGRHVWLRFPLHPGGYALAFCHQGSYMWFPALVLWAAKTLTLRLGGVRTYRRAARGFLAFTLGHFFAIGLWSLVGLAAGEWVRRYIVWFL
ncbi:MAG: hypothetical protein FJX75_24935 [Armatimonadetes bacterium]|nr:hypothetical protein [Armatimonadota bacterium]